MDVAVATARQVFLQRSVQDWGRILERTGLVRPSSQREYLEEFVKKCKSVLIRIAARY